MRLPKWLGGGRGEKSVTGSEAEDMLDLQESKRERQQIWREHNEMQARIQSLREIAEFLGRMHPR